MKYGVLGVADLRALGSKISEYRLQGFSKMLIGNEHPVIVKG
jgi:hypothetical protein